MSGERTVLLIYCRAKKVMKERTDVQVTVRSTPRFC